VNSTVDYIQAPPSRDSRQLTEAPNAADRPKEAAGTTGKTASQGTANWDSDSQVLSVIEAMDATNNHGPRTATGTSTWPPPPLPPPSPRPPRSRTTPSGQCWTIPQVKKHCTND
jgi:hypothetical protein